MANVTFEDFTIQVQEAINDRAIAALEEAAGEIESQAKDNSRVDTGRTRNSFEHKVVDSELKAYIGSNYENAIWEEFGTGEYALEGNGRKGGWVYVDEKGKGHFTRGKKGTRALWNAFEALKPAVARLFENEFRGL